MTMEEKDAQKEFLLAYICALLKIRQALKIYCSSCGSGCKCMGILDSKINEHAKKLSKLTKDAEALLKAREDYVTECREKNPERFKRIFKEIYDKDLEKKIRADALSAEDLMIINGLK